MRGRAELRHEWAGSTRRTRSDYILFVEGYPGPSGQGLAEIAYLIQVQLNIIDGLHTYSSFNMDKGPFKYYLSIVQDLLT